ncbi:MAG TPA: LON peptidase substrate-binding domain-containing protein, partial [Methanobacterium sp.]|nr:LON peptidase substrate-binding domain-containing protein [Methanobacterium sp.]
MTEMNINKELSVLVIPNTVYLNKTDITLKISKKAGSEFYKRVAKDDFYGIALAVREGSTEGLYCEDDFYSVGTLIKIENAKAMRDFYQIKMEIVERVEIEKLIPEGSNFRATYKLIPDIIDLEPENEKDIIKHIKYLVSEISENFKGSKTYVEQVNKLDDITEIIAYIFPYMRISLEEKQA